MHNGSEIRVTQHERHDWPAIHYQLFCGFWSLDSPSNAASTTFPSSTVGQITSLDNLNISSPSYPRALFLPFLPLFELEPVLSTCWTSGCVARTVESNGNTAFASRVGVRGEWSWWQLLRTTWMVCRNDRRCDLGDMRWNSSLMTRRTYDIFCSRWKVR